MGISHDIISEFVKITNDKKEKPKEETVYATIVQTSDGKYVKLDGSDLVTPTETTTDIEEGERVTVLIKDHSAIITGNISSPSASVNRVNGIVDVVSEKLGVFETIVADKIDVNELNAYKATIENLIVGKAEIEDLIATRAQIGFLDADVAHIKTLVNGNLTSDNILSFNITADKVTMADAFIKDAMVDTINAAKINAGRINTNNVVIGSDDGGMLISGATQQFTDKDGKVRIQIGRDSTGDFTFVLYGEDGTGQIINQNGITASAVSDGLIVNDMINNNAAISGGKLDISSVIFEINNENDTAIHSSKIYLDEQNQSLEAAFNSLKTQVDTIIDVSIDGDLKAFTEQIQSNTAKIEMNKSSINTLVSEDAIIRKEVSDLEGNLIETSNTLSSKYSSLEQNMDGFKLEVADVYAKKSTVKDLENDIATNYATTEVMNSAITQNATEIATTVAREEIQNIQIGGVNLLLNSDAKKQLDRAESGKYNEISYTLVNDYAGLTLNNDTTFVLSFMVDRTGNTEFECFDTIAMDGGWYNRWNLGDRDKIIYIQGTTYKFVMKPRIFPKGTRITDKLTFIAEYNQGGGRFYNVMLVEGNKAFDWQPSFKEYSTTTQMNSTIQQKADEIALTVAKKEIQNMQVGGTNLLTGTKTLTGAGLSGQIVPEKHKDCNIIHEDNDNGSGYKDVISYSGITLEPSTEYTLSFWAQGRGFISSYLYPDAVEFGYHHNFENRTTNMSDGSINTDLEERTWKRYAITWKTKPNVSETKNLIVGRIHGGIPRGCCYISAPKLEKGNKPTDWSDSPLEKPTISDMNSAIQQKADEITSTVNMTKMAGVELLPQGYRRGNSTSGYSVRSGGTLNCNEYGLYVTERTFVISDYIAVDPNLPIAYEYDITTSGGTPLICLGVEQYTGTKEEVGANAATIYFLETYVNGNKKDSGTLTLNSNTRYIRFRWLSDWNSSGMSWCQLGGISLKQLGSINQSTQISQMSDSITSTVSTVNGLGTRMSSAESKITQNANSISSTVSSVNGLGTRMSSAESRITQNANSISSTVSSVNGLGTRMSSAESRITQNANSIATKVDVNGVKSTIQQNPESVRIGFNSISDYFDLNSTRLKVGHSDGSYTEIGQNGVMYYANGSGNRYHSLMKQGWLGQISGTSWSRTITLPSEFKGKSFSVIVSVTEVNAVNTHDVIKHFKVTVPHGTVNYTNATFVINMSALAYYVPGQQSASAIQTDVSWIAIC